MNTKNNYTFKTNNIFIKLINKLCREKDKMVKNTRFVWYGKYVVQIMSRFNNAIFVCVSDIETEDKTIASFEIDFDNNKLTFTSIHKTSLEDFVIADSMIKSFIDIHSNINVTIDDRRLWEKEYAESVKVLNNVAQHSQEKIQGAVDLINICNKRNEQITNLM